MTDVAALLDAWDAAGRAPAPARAAVLADRLGLLPAGTTAPIGACAEALAAAHRQMFGTTLVIAVECPGCAGLLDVQLDLSRLPAWTETAEVITSAGPVTVRSLSTADLVAAGDSGQPERALLAATVRGTDPDRLSAADLEQIDSVAEELAGPAALAVRAECPGCGAEARAGVELGGLVWARLGRWADRRLAEVDALARAYGWTEAEVFALPPGRRARYLELARR